MSNAVIYMSEGGKSGGDSVGGRKVSGMERMERIIIEEPEKKIGYEKSGVLLSEFVFCSTYHFLELYRIS